MALDEALKALATESPESVQIVEMRYFGGLEGKEIVAVTGLSEATVTRRLRTARAWLYRYLSRPGAEPAVSGTAALRNVAE